jgi:type IV pilus assembly protein PilE
MKKRSARRGFTLIEVMTVSSIVAILAAVALPELSARLRRAKRAEADIAMAKIEQSVKNYFNDKGRFTTRTSSTASTMTATWNPSALTSTSRFDPKATGWSELEVPLDGRNRYFAYQLSGAHSGSSITFTMTLRSDLDGDGAVALRTRTWTMVRNQWLLSSDLMSGDNEY